MNSLIVMKHLLLWLHWPKKWQEKYGKDSDSRGMKYTRKVLLVKFWLTEEAVTKL